MAYGQKREGGYFAKYCIEKVLKDNMPTMYTEKDKFEDSEFNKALAVSGNLFEHYVGSLLESTCTEKFTVVKEKVRSQSDLEKPRLQSDLHKKEEDTFAAVFDPNVTVIFNPRISDHFESLLCRHRGETPHDLDPLRVSEPDILVRLDSGWAAVDVKDHATYNEKENSGQHELAFSTLATPSQLNEWTKVRSTINKPDDLLQLSHYYRHLQALGLAYSEPIGAIIGRSEAPTLCWLHLDWGRSTPLDTYDRQFADRLAQRDLGVRLNVDDPTAARPDNPGKYGACKTCEWWNVCKGELEKADHLTLLPNIGRTQHQNAIDLGLPTTRSGLADLSLDEAEEKGWTGSNKISAYWAARALKAGKMILRDDEATKEIPQCDIEVDFDLENSLAHWSGTGDDLTLQPKRLYMYSIVVTENNISKPYQFDRYEGNDKAELKVFVDTWKFCQDLIARSVAENKTIRFFHYTQPERNWPRELSAKYVGRKGVPSHDEVEEFLESLTDLYDLATVGRAWPTSGVGLKPLAKFTGYKWGSDKAAGDQSTIWFKTVADPNSTVKNRAAALALLRQYGMDDVWAQLHLRRAILKLDLAT